MLFTNIAVTF